MKIEQLRQMVELSRTGSMNQAAANLFMSQPNLSISIRNLEEELGAELVMRGSRGVTLTTHGEEFVAYAESVVAQFDRLGALCQTFERSPVPEFSLVNTRYRFAVDAAARLSQRAEPVSLKIREGGWSMAVESVRKGDSEIGVLGFMCMYRKDLIRQFKAKDMEYHMLAKNTLCVEVGKGSPLYDLPDGSKLTTKMLEGYPQIRHEGMDYSHFTDRRQKMKLPVPACEFLVSNRAVARELLETTPAYMICHMEQAPYRYVKYYSNARVLPLEDVSVESEVGWIHRSDKPLSPLAQEYVRILASYFE